MSGPVTAFRNHGAIGAVAAELSRNRDDDDDSSHGSVSRKFLPISLATLGVVLGMAAFLSALHVNSVHTGLWGLSSGAFAAFCLHLAVLDRLGVVEKWYSPEMLGNIVKLGFVVQIFGLIGTIVYITITVAEHHGHSGLKAGFYLTTAGALLTFIWGLYLSVFAWKLKVWMERKNASLLGGVRAYPDA